MNFMLMTFHLIAGFAISGSIVYALLTMGFPEIEAGVTGILIFAAFPIPSFKLIWGSTEKTHYSIAVAGGFSGAIYLTSYLIGIPSELVGLIGIASLILSIYLSHRLSKP